MSRSPLPSSEQPVTSHQTLARRSYLRAFSTSRTQSDMDKNLKKVVGGDNRKRGPNRYTRLLLNDDHIVMSRGGPPSAVIADLVRKDLAYEALAAGADDTAIRNLLRIFDQIVQHRVVPLAEALATSQRSLGQTQIFVASLFLTFAAKFEFPLENCSEDERADIHETLAAHTNDMLTFVTSPTAVPPEPREQDHHPAPANRADHAGTGGV